MTGQYQAKVCIRPRLPEVDNQQHQREDAEANVDLRNKENGQETYIKVKGQNNKNGDVKARNNKGCRRTCTKSAAPNSATLRTFKDDKLTRIAFPALTVMIATKAA